MELCLKEIDCPAGAVEGLVPTIVGRKMPSESTIEPGTAVRVRDDLPHKHSGMLGHVLSAWRESGEVLVEIAVEEQKKVVWRKCVYHIDELEVL